MTATTRPTASKLGPFPSRKMRRLLPVREVTPDYWEMITARASLRKNKAEVELDRAHALFIFLQREFRTHLAEAGMKYDQSPEGIKRDRARAVRLLESIDAMDFFILTQRQKTARMMERRSNRDAHVHRIAYFGGTRQLDDIDPHATTERGQGIVPCDIHAMIEVKIPDAAGWDAVCQGALYVPQDYALFAYLAGVRSFDGIEPLVPLRGFPSDKREKISPDAEREYAHWADFAHDEGWLTPQEWIAACVSARLKTGKTHVEALAIGNHAKALADSDKYEAARIVFWFNS